MLLKVFIDESADEKQKKAAAVGAFIGTSKQWNSLKIKWFRRLAREGIQYFRSTEYYSLRGQFQKFRDPVKYPKPEGSKAAAKVRDDLEALIISKELVGFALCIRMDDWNAALASDPKASQILTNPFEIATQLLISEIYKSVVEEVGKGCWFTFVSDRSQSARRIEKVYLEFKRINPWIDRPKGFTHLDDKSSAPLQAADMMAGIAREVLLDSMKTGGIVNPKRLGERIAAVKCPGVDFLLEMVRKEKTRRGLT